METKKDDLIFSLTKTDFQETAEEQFETTLSDEQFEYLENKIWEGGLSDFMYDLVFETLAHFQTLKRSEDIK
jgi:PBP1b-binding outer membrane lipoprotein LpoB